MIVRTCDRRRTGRVQSGVIFNYTEAFDLEQVAKYTLELELLP